MALVTSPDLLLLDETLGGLDPHALIRAQHVIDEAMNRGAALILSTHMMDVAVRLCDRALFMSGGRIVHEMPLRKNGVPLSPLELDETYRRVVPDPAAQLVTALASGSS